MRIPTCNCAAYHAPWMIASSLALVVVALAMTFLLPDEAWGQALLYSAFPIALIVSPAPASSPHAGRRSLLVRVVGAAAMYAAFVGVTMLARAF